MSAAPTPTDDLTPDGADSGGANEHEGFVPQDQLDREVARTRSFQAERDKLQAELDRVKLANTPPKADEKDDKPTLGFDPDEFRRQVTRDAFHATSMARAAEALRADYPHADDDLFTAARITDFGSVEAFKFAVEDSHKRVDSKIKSERAKIEEDVRKEFAEKYGVSITPNASEGKGTGTPAGDPTPEQLARMSASEWDTLEERSPGAINRILAKSALL